MTARKLAEKIDFKKSHILKRYPKEVKNPMPRSDFASLISEVNNRCIEKVITEGKKFIIPSLMTVMVEMRKTTYTDKEGNFTTKYLYPDWGKTWKFWHDKYKGMTREEIVAIKDKKVLFSDNSSNDGYYYKMRATLRNGVIKGSAFYKVVPVKGFRQKLSKHLKTPNGKNTVYFTEQ